jgi:hypothetical protein
LKNETLELLFHNIFRTSFTSKRSIGSKGAPLNGLNLGMNALGFSMQMLPSNIAGTPSLSLEMKLGKNLQNTKKKPNSSGPLSRKDWESQNSLA